MKTTEQVIEENKAWAEKEVAKVTQVDTLFLVIEVILYGFIGFMTFMYLFFA